MFFICTAAALESGYEASYELKVGSLTVGKMERTFKRGPRGYYEFNSFIRATGLASFLSSDELFEASSGRYQAGNYLPENYIYERKRKRKPRSINTHFDRIDNTIETIYNGTQISMPLKENILDNLVYQAALMEDLASGKTALSYTIADRREEKIYTAEIRESAQIETDIGDFETVMVVREEPGSKKRTIFWCAPDLNYLPVRIAHREKDGKETIVTLTEYRRL
jgi:hypothetical protein